MPNLKDGIDNLISETKAEFTPTDINMSRNRNRDYIEYMDTDLIDKYKEYDREKDYESGEWYLDSLTGHIKSKGIEEPLVMGYNPTTGVTRLIEGNHRLAAAKRLGISQLPVRMIRQNYMEGTPESKKRHGYDIVDPKLSKMYEDRKIKYAKIPKWIDNFKDVGSPSDLKPSEWFNGEELKKIRPYNRDESQKGIDIEDSDSWYETDRMKWIK